MREFLKHPCERIDDLPCGGIKIIQDNNSYKFAIDAVLLADFVKAGKRDNILDMGTGSGVIALLLSSKTDARKIVGIEIVASACDRAKRSVEMNKLQHRIEIVKGDLKKAPNIFGMQSFSVVVTNPPYMTVKEGSISPKQDLAIARHEVSATLKDIVKSAHQLLIFGGRFYMVYRTFRMTEAIWELREKGLEPKLLRFIHPKASESPNLFLVMAQKGAKTGLKILPPLVVYNDDGTYTDEIRRIYFAS